MKLQFLKLLVVVITIFALTACSSKAASITQTNLYPAAIDDYIDNTMSIQLIYDNEHKAYLVYNDIVSGRAFVSKLNHTLTIHIQTDNTADTIFYEQPQAQIFKLSLPSAIDTLVVELNGEVTHFDRIAYLN